MLAPPWGVQVGPSVLLRNMRAREKEEAGLGGCTQSGRNAPVKSRDGIVQAARVAGRACLDCSKTIELEPHRREAVVLADLGRMVHIPARKQSSTDTDQKECAEKNTRAADARH
jgi:hypothetical protein